MFFIQWILYNSNTHGELYSVRDMESNYRGNLTEGTGKYFRVMEVRVIESLLYIFNYLKIDICKIFYPFQSFKTTKWHFSDTRHQTFHVSFEWSRVGIS